MSAHHGMHASPMAMKRGALAAVLQKLKVHLHACMRAWRFAGFDEDVLTLCCGGPGRFNYNR
jgi:hypothetical protein